ncbi:LysR family transcriptional regulator [Aliidiomarina quisquiliarum]|uniref:LysR family transcriptional regulator n=1 Tax=Aliidiomarina quisquiliarum TaxID=2938947 RepID=UPI00208F12D1|nr:LysR family transcriptional regulator [Aliidiomarina quisquiliarum]MCO4322124.1 LysR family transcriptional regulator [Aliidiomarina quisquiliarum]
MQWEGITEFVYVAENESFTQAAKRIGISTAQVSRQVSALEKRLRIQLFYRTTRKVTLTEEGRIFYQHCRSVLDGLDAAKRAITNLQTKPQGKIKMTAPVAFGEKQILPLVSNFALKYGDVEVDAYLTNRQIDLVDEGYDLAIRIGKLSDSTMMAKKLSKRTNYVCASPKYVDIHGIPHSISELTKHSCLLGTPDHWHFSKQGKEISVRMTGRLRYNNGYSLTDAALKGLGIVQLPDYYVEPYLKSGELISVLDHNRAPDERIWAIYPHNRHLSPKVRLLVDYLAEQLV